MENQKLADKVFNGAKWSVLERVANQAFHFVISIVLARLLLPEAFGTVGMILILVGFANMVADTGFAAALIQRKELSDAHIHSVFWFNIAIGIALTILMFSCAPAVARFYDKPVLASLTEALSTTFILSAPGMVPIALLQRRMAFRTIAIIRILSTLISGTSAVFLAYNGVGMWSLVVQSLVFNSLTTVMSILLLKWRPHMMFRIQAIRDLWRYTINHFGWNILNFWSRNVDGVLIGRFFGSADLGYYTRTYALMLIPNYQIINVFAKVMFPALSSIQDQPWRIKQICLRAISVFSVIISPLMLGMVVTAEPFVLTLYGSNWVNMIPLLQILAMVGLLQAFLPPINWIYGSTGRTDLMFRWGLVNSLSLMAGIVVGVAMGSIYAVAWCYALVNLILFYPAYVVAGRLVDLHFRELLRAVGGPLFASIVMAILILMLRTAIPSHWTSLVQFSVLVITGAAIYFSLLLITRPAGWQEVTVIIQDRVLKQFKKRPVQRDVIQ
jgi:PST family polysaccharide transporter